jgi:predicted RNase H-like HicB family nuclease
MSVITTGNNASIPVKRDIAQNIAQDTKETYRIFLEKGLDGWIVVTSPDLKSLVTQGKTEDDAIANAYEATELLLEESGQKKEFNLVVIDQG